MNKNIVIASILTVAVFATSTVATPSAFALPAQSCFGVGSSYLGTTGQMGDHASGFDEPRAGIGNVAAGLGLTVWDLGAFLLFLLAGIVCP
jgi:hypothetical protein